MRTFSELIVEWIKGHPSRNAAALARLTGVSPAEISLIIRGKKPCMDVAVRLGKVLPSGEVMFLMCEIDPDFRILFVRFCQDARAIV